MIVALVGSAVGLGVIGAGVCRVQACPGAQTVTVSIHVDDQLEHPD